MRRWLAGSVLVLAVGSSGCWLDEHDGGPPADRSAVIITDDCPGEESLPDDLALSGTELTVGLSVGCMRTEEWVCWDGRFAETTPVVASLEVRHRHGGDCLVIVPAEVTVSLQPMIDAYQDAYGEIAPMELRFEGNPAVVWVP